jgi:hypothetical protein
MKVLFVITRKYWLNRQLNISLFNIISFKLNESRNFIDLYTYDGPVHHIDGTVGDENAQNNFEFYFIDCSRL